MSTRWGAGVVVRSNECAACSWMCIPVARFPSWTRSAYNIFCYRWAKMWALFRATTCMPLYITRTVNLSERAEAYENYFSDKFGASANEMTSVFLPDIAAHSLYFSFHWKCSLLIKMVLSRMSSIWVPFFYCINFYSFMATSFIHLVGYFNLGVASESQVEHL